MGTVILVAYLGGILPAFVVACRITYASEIMDNTDDRHEAMLFGIVAGLVVGAMWPLFSFVAVAHNLLFPPPRA